MPLSPRVFLQYKKCGIRFHATGKNGKILSYMKYFHRVHIHNTIKDIYTTISNLFVLSRYVIINMLFVLVFYNFQTQVDIGFKKIMWECLMKIQIQ